MAKREPWPTKRARTRVALSEAALELVQRHGFDSVTVDEIADRAGASRTTFFRCFDTKDEAILHHLDASAAELLREAGRGLVAGPPWPALRLGCVASTRHLLLWPNSMRALLGMIDDHPVLRAGRLTRTAAVALELAAMIAAEHEDPPEAALAARCALAIADTATDAWRTDADVDLVRMIIAGFDRLAPGFG